MSYDAIDQRDRTVKEAMEAKILAMGNTCGSQNPRVDGDCNSVMGGRPLTPAESAERLLKADAAHRSLAADQVLMLHMVTPFAEPVFRQLCQGINQWMRHQGFWKANPGQGSEPNKAEKVALVVTECAEWIEAIRHDDPANEREEIADTVIRIMDYCGEYNIDLAGEIRKKMLANYQRPYKHGKAF